MIPLFLSLALLTVTDPAPGPTGASVLTAPSSAMYRNLAPFDLREVSVLDSDTLELRLELGAWANPLGLDNGFSHPIIEIYLGSAEPGLTGLLPGSGMRLPDGESWTVALQLTGDYARGWFVSGQEQVPFEPELQLIDDHLFVMTGLPRIENPRVAAMTGLYSPFHETGWRPLESDLSPWAFSSAEQVFPVVDVLALDVDAQLTALSGGILPVTEVNTIENPNTVWFALMAGGIALAGIGLVLRGLSGTPAAETGTAARETAEEPHEEDVAERTAARLSALVASDRGTAPAAEPAAEETVAELESEDGPDDEEIAAPRVGVFRGHGDVVAAEPADEAGTGPDLPLPELASVDFGEFELPAAADEDDHEDDYDDEDEEGRPG